MKKENNMNKLKCQCSPTAILSEEGRNNMENTQKPWKIYDSCKKRAHKDTEKHTRNTENILNFRIE